MKLYKTTVVIWTAWEPTLSTTLEDLAREAISGDAYCSAMRQEMVPEPERDTDWDGTEFFLEDTL